jgi:cation diffusion facilitator family transporter
LKARLSADAWHHLSDAITSTFAFIGISIALLTENPGGDDWAALCASPIILFNGIRQMHSPIAELLNTAPPKKMDVEVCRIAGAAPQVTNVEKCIIRKVGFRYYVDLHVRVPGHLSVSDGHAIAHSVRHEVLRQLARCRSPCSHRAGLAPCSARQIAIGRQGRRLVRVIHVLFIEAKIHCDAKSIAIRRAT